MSSFDKFLEQFVESFSGKDPMIFSVLGNVFSMRIIGNKTHGDLAEIALTEYINQFVDGFTAKHTGKEKFRAKEFEEDIRVAETATQKKFKLVSRLTDLVRFNFPQTKTGQCFLSCKKKSANEEQMTLRK